MAKSVYRTALEAYSFPVGGGDFSIKEVRDKGFLVLRIPPEDGKLRSASANAGVPIPESPLKVETGSSAATLWISPDEFLAVCSLAGKDDLMDQLSQGFSGEFASVVDNSGGYSLLELDGSLVPKVLAKSVAYPLDQLPEGNCVSTAMAKSQAIFWKKSQTSFFAFFRFSFADYLLQILLNDAQEFQPELGKIVSPYQVAHPKIDWPEF